MPAPVKVQSPSAVRHGSEAHPKTGSLRSSAGSDRAAHDRASAALPDFGTSSAKTLRSRSDAIAKWSPASPPGMCRAGPAKSASSKPTTPGQYRAGAADVALASMHRFSASGGHRDLNKSTMNIRVNSDCKHRNFRRTGPKARVSPRWITAGRTLECRHDLPGLNQHRVEVTTASALPSDLHWQLDDRGSGLRQCLNALCPEFRFGHGGLSRFGFEWRHGSSGAVQTVCVLAGAALVQSPRW
jgi:hypothetical protein